MSLPPFGYKIASISYYNRFRLTVQKKKICYVRIMYRIKLKSRRKYTLGKTMLRANIGFFPIFATTHETIYRSQLACSIYVTQYRPCTNREGGGSESSITLARLQHGRWLPR